MLFAGPYQHVLGEEAYAERLAPMFKQYQAHWQFVGVLNSDELAALYPNCDLIVLPSLNSTESFGLVQVEAMLHGTLAVASNLPGVRQPVRISGMGEIAPIGDSAGLADAILKVLHHHERYVRPAHEVEALFNIDATVSAYEEVFADVQKRKIGQQR
ncbi:MAG: hypothetical protein NVSMB42_14660 [Herpetosiphon sp.]